VSAAELWLRQNLPATDPLLLQRMLAALPDEGVSVPEILAEGALRLYGEVARSRGTRDDALPLLAADALLTHAFQAQAEADPGGLAKMAARWGAAGRLGRLATGSAV
jgi:hypothetical protein